jgi:hypothetical protein
MGWLSIPGGVSWRQSQLSKHLGWARAQTRKAIHPELDGNQHYASKHRWLPSHFKQQIIVGFCIKSASPKE